MCVASAFARLLAPVPLRTLAARARQPAPHHAASPGIPAAVQRSRNRVPITLAPPSHHRFLRGKTVDRARYDEWKDQTQTVSGGDGDEMTDIEVSLQSFAIQEEDDDEQVHVPATPEANGETDGVALLVKLVPV